MDRATRARLAISCLDLTDLDPDLSAEALRALVDRATSASVAALCVHWSRVEEARVLLADSTVCLAAVAGDFPWARAPSTERLNEVERAVQLGADEIDVALPRGIDHARSEVVALRTGAGTARLKVIIETGELGSAEEIARVARAAIEGGADFIKTSTGTERAPGATLQSTQVLTSVVGDHDAVGIKVSGGISTPDIAFAHMDVAESALGNLDPRRFRIGASRLLYGLVSELES
jgi:deoxyribose-phosphate aldolase